MRRAEDGHTGGGGAGGGGDGVSDVLLNFHSHMTDTTSNESNRESAYDFPSKITLPSSVR
jgi:hypothetical protein